VPVCFRIFLYVEIDGVVERAKSMYTLHPGQTVPITVDISFGLASMPGSETRLSNAALSINLKLVVIGEITHEISHGL